MVEMGQPTIEPGVPNIPRGILWGWPEQTECLRENPARGRIEIPHSDMKPRDALKLASLVGGSEGLAKLGMTEGLRK
jgi:hypothetical protein